MSKTPALAIQSIQTAPLANLPENTKIFWDKIINIISHEDGFTDISHFSEALGIELPMQRSLDQDGKIYYLNDEDARPFHASLLTGTVNSYSSHYQQSSINIGWRAFPTDKNCETLSRFESTINSLGWKTGGISFQPTLHETFVKLNATINVYFNERYSNTCLQSITIATLKPLKKK